MSIIITIGREFGSGGRELGKRLAEELGIAYYDREIVEEVAKNTKLAYEYVSNVIEKAPSAHFPITIGNSFNIYHNDVIFDNTTSIRQEQTKVIRELASKGDCVIVGRCADYILRDMNPFRIFVYSDIESKIKRCKEKGEISPDLTDKKITKMILNIDKQRRKYYEFYTSNKWGDIKNYDVCINTTNKNIKDVTKAIIKLFE